MDTLLSRRGSKKMIAHKIILLFPKHDLQVNIIGERRNLMNRRVEILITNYDTSTLIEKDLFNT